MLVKFFYNKINLKNYKDAKVMGFLILKNVMFIEKCTFFKWKSFLINSFILGKSRANYKRYFSFIN